MFYRYILKYTSLLGSVQVLNVLLSTCTMGLLSALAADVFEDGRARLCTQVMLMAFVPPKLA